MFSPQKAIEELWGNRPKTAHKSQNGHVLVVGGSPEYAGAPILASVAALESGAGMVTLAAPAKVVLAAQTFCPDIMGFPLKGDYLSGVQESALLRIAAKADVVLIGNGAGKKAIPLLKKLIPKLMRNNTQLVLDATAFDALSQKGNLNNCILLPHVGEFERWQKTKIKKMSFSARVKLLKKIIGTKKIVINLKDWRSVIASCHYSYINKTGNAGMGKAGMGDVLAGLTAGFWSQGMGAFSSTASAAWLNGKMSEKMKGRKWYGYIANDLLEEIKKMKNEGLK